MTNYTNNYIPNPSFETSIAGYTQLTGTLIVRDTTTAAFGSSSLKITTDGITAGEGFSTPVATVPSSATGSASIHLMGSGIVTVSAVSTGGAVLSTLTVNLTGSFTRYILNGLTITGTNVPVQIFVQTPNPQKLTFWADSVQVEPESPATPYCDGDQAGCNWTGTAELSTSFRQFQFGLSSTAGSTVSGRVAIIIPGEIFPVTGIPVDVVQVSGSVTPTVISPVSVFDDFAIFTSADNDPAQTYALWNSGGIMTGYNNYNEGYMYVTPPLDYPVSGGQFAWRRAAFAAIGYQFVNLASGAAANLTNVQAEFPQINGSSSVTPRGWQTPRVINTIVKPNRLNYVTNPSFETGLTGWSATGTGASVASDATVFTPAVGEYGNLLYNAGAVSLKTSIASAGTNQGCTTTISNLIVGRQYVASAYVMPGTGIADIVMTISDGTGSAANDGTPYGDGTYGGGMYGGLPASLAQLTTGQWYRPNCIFTATADTHTLTLKVLEVSGASYPVHFWTDAVLVEDGEVLQPYFDGTFGKDAFWEGSITGTASTLFTFDAGLGTWIGISGATLSTATTWAYQGTTSAIFHGDGTTATPGIESTGIIPVIVGDSYTATAWSFSFQGWASGLVISIEWLNSSGSHLSTTSASAVALTLGAATFLTVTGTAPSNAAFGNIIISAAGTPGSTVTFQIDEVQIMPFNITSGRSYYYNQFAAKQHLVTDVLTKNTPLGILYTPPQFAVPFTQ